MGQGGVSEKNVVQTEKISQAQPKRSCLQPPASFKHKNARFLLSSTDPDSWIFSTNLQHQKCRASCHDSIHT